MRVGFIGLGKLGLPCALAMEKFGGHEIAGFDTAEQVVERIRDRHVDYFEAGVNELLATTDLKVSESILDLAAWSDVLFIAVPTPHEAKFEGVTPTPVETRDFDYSHLREVAEELRQARIHLGSLPLCVVISTCLPGTMDREFLPRLRRDGAEVDFAYNPYFIAMGTTIADFLNPEFILIGAESERALSQLKKVYAFIDAPTVSMDVKSAELTKVAYNTFIGMKLVFVNALAELSNSVGCNVDRVTEALSLADRRLMSPAYMTAGMADGGGCHPRDQIAMSWLAKSTNMSFDVFGAVARARDAQTKRQAEMIVEYSAKRKLPVVLLGEAYKPNTPLTVGSPALLLAHYVGERIPYEIFDPVTGRGSTPSQPSLFFISCRHDQFATMQLPEGSLVIDPWGMRSAQDGVEVVRPGRTMSAE